MAEFGPEANSPEIQAAIDIYFTGLHEFVATTVKPLELGEPEKTVVQILSLIQGSIVMVQSTRDHSIARANRDAARLLLEDGMSA